MKKKLIVSGAVGIPLVLFAIFGMWLREADPMNQDGYHYRDYIYAVGMSSDMGVFTFDIVEREAFNVYCVGGILFVETPGTTYQGECPPGFEPFTYTTSVKIGEHMFTGLAPNTFMSVYHWPDGSWEILQGTRPLVYSEFDTLGVVDLLDYSTSAKLDLIKQMQADGVSAECTPWGIVVLRRTNAVTLDAVGLSKRVQ